MGKQCGLYGGVVRCVDVREKCDQRSDKEREKMA